MKLLSLNIKFNLANNQAVVGLIRELAPDLVLLQEVIEHNQNSVLEKYRSKEYLDVQLRTLYPHRFFTKLWQSENFLVNGRQIFEPGGRVTQGNYLLSKYPFMAKKECFFYGKFEVNNDWSDFEKNDHGRAIQMVEIDCPDAHGTKLTVVNIHGIWTQDKLGDERTFRADPGKEKLFGGR
jgi:endonuclease/exonuclease/phosphatase family metal-dependent hydrolase